MEIYNYKAVIRRIIDGDTVEVDIDLGFKSWLLEQNVRLLGVDAPESRTRDKAAKKAGLLAKEMVQKYLPPGKEVIITTRLEKKPEKFGRILATFYVDGLNLNQWLLDNNYAVAYEGQSKEDVTEAHLANRKILEARGEL